MLKLQKLCDQKNQSAVSTTCSVELFEYKQFTNFKGHYFDKL